MIHHFTSSQEDVFSFFCLKSSMVFSSRSYIYEFCFNSIFSYSLDSPAYSDTVLDAPTNFEDVIHTSVMCFSIPKPSFMSKISTFTNPKKKKSSSKAPLCPRNSKCTKDLPFTTCNHNKQDHHRYTSWFTADACQTSLGFEISEVIS